MNITFNGNNRNRNYQLVIDGISYYSNNATQNGKKTISLDNLAPGSHELAVYSDDDNRTYSDGTSNAPAAGSLVYSKTFELRSNYDMNIAVRPNGSVTFSEKTAKRRNQDVTSRNKTPMTLSTYNQIYQNVRSRSYQSDRISLLTSAFNNTSYNFTTTQVRELLSLISNESRRLELAKLSYSRVTDPSNFNYVSSVFNSQVNRDALEDYVVSREASAYSNSNIYNNNGYGRTAMSESDFDAIYRKAGGHFTQKNRITEVRNALNTSTNYFSSYQIRQLVSLIAAQSERLSLLKLGYSRVTDPLEYYQLTDLLSTQSYKDDLSNYIRSQGGIVRANDNNTYYNRTPISDASFTEIYNGARSHFFQKNTIEDVRAAFNNTNNYYSTEQIRQLLLLVSSESERLSLAKLSYARVADATNFSRIYELFNDANRDELSRYVNNQ